MKWRFRIVPKRIPAITDEILRREAGSLSNEVLVLPEQMIILTGLSVANLKERIVGSSGGYPAV
jgi:hypothetical protein